MQERMDNGAYNQDPEKGTELDLVVANETNPNTNDANGANGVNNITLLTTQSKSDLPKTIQTPSSTPQPSMSCRPDICQAARSKYSPPDLRGNPWHKKKSIYLGVTISLLVLWIIIYSTLSSMNLL